MKYSGYVYGFIALGFVLLSILIYISRSKSAESFTNTTCVVYKFHKSVGFFSNFFFICEYYIRAKRAGYDFYIDSSDWSYSFKNGWHDYFDSLTEINDTHRNKYSNIIYGVHVSSKSEYENSINQIDNANPIRLSEYSMAITDIFKPSKSIRDKVDTIMHKYNNRYDAIYIRRGDKITSNESKFIETADILKQISTTNKLLYIQTDDYTEVESIRKLMPEKTVETNTLESQRGANESDRHSYTPEEKKKNTEDFLIGIILCANANQCWVDILSNVSRFIKLYGKNVNFYKISNETIDYDLNKDVVNPAFASSFMK